MADARLFAKLDLGYFDNPKIADFIEDHPHAIFLHLRAILYCRQHLTDGHFPVRLVCRMASATYCGSECESECDYCRAVAAGLFERVDAKTGNVSKPEDFLSPPARRGLQASHLLVLLCP